MASQTTRPRFRLPSVVRPAPIPAPAPAPTLAPGPPPPQPRPPLIRPTFRPITEPPPPPPPEPAAAPAPVQSPPPPVTTLPPPPPIATPAPPPPTPATTPPPPSPPPPSPSVPSSPQKPTPPSPRLQPKPSPTSPIRSFASPKQASTAYTEPIPTTASRVAIPPPPQAQEPSPRTIKPAVQTPPQSPYRPKPTVTAPPPSPLVLPPPLVIKPEPSETDQARIPPEAEQKIVLVQTTKFTDQDKPNKPWQNGSDSERPFPETCKPVFTENHHMKKVSSDSEERGTRVITIAGENRGAFMEVILSPLKGIPHKLYKKENPVNHEEGSGWKSYNSSSSSNGEEKANKSSLGKAGKGRGIESPAPSPMRAFMNSNVQGVNNSILFNSSCNHHDPGVHLSYSRKPAVGGTSRASKEEPGNNEYQS